ncbi:hypothetical protein CS538_18595 [Clostridium combesii]|uniref:N-acetyltransferase n=1 Tax=Clostridium combesii TaxID=39481 RepID=A0A2G7H2L5_9CLOT|nr:hypothetical protein CS538_18595 [Clostridium combesii]
MLNHKGTITLKTQRLILRRFAIDDADSVFNNWENDNDICKHMRWTQHKNIEETKMIISR